MVRLAVIGTGRMASIHFKNILNHPIATCNHVISNRLSRAQEFLSSHNQQNSSITPSADLEATLKEHNKDIDGVVITSKSPQHYTQIKKCLLYNKPVFVEKPIAESLSEIDDLYQTAAHNGFPPISVGYQRRFDPNIRNIYKQIHEQNVLLPTEKIPELKRTIGGIEKIVSISKDPTYPDVKYITGNINCFYDSIIHDIDTICYLSKQFPNKVYCAAHAHYKPVKKLKDFDRIFITLHFPSGLLGMIDWCRHSGFSYDQRLQIQGYNGMLEVVNEKDNLVVRHGGNGAICAKPKDYFLERYAEAYKNEIDDFVEVIQGKREVCMDYEQVRNVNVVVACTEKSARSGMPVEIDYRDDVKCKID